jgi:hypothetical protein
MTRNDLAQMSHDELIDLVLAQAQENAKLQADVDALRVKLEKAKSRRRIRVIHRSRHHGIKKATCQ